MRSRVILLLWVAGISSCVSVVLFWAFEHGHNPGVKNAFDVLWWWVVTSATVGYGDIVPLTWQGRAVAIFAVLTGFFIYASFVAIIAEFAHEYLERRVRGTAQVEAANHIVICEYTAVADELIQSLPNCPSFAKKEVVIVSDLVNRSPYPQHHFVCGVPISPQVLNRANVKDADYVFIFANLRFADPDVKTIHTASRVLELNSKAMVFVEMVDSRNDLLKYASRPLVAMDSRKLIECVLQNRMIDPEQMLKEKREG